MEKIKPFKVFGYAMAITAGVKIGLKIPVILDAITCFVAKRKFPEAYDFAVNKLKKEQ